MESVSQSGSALQGYGGLVADRCFDDIFRAEKIKEDYTYVCQDIVKEIKKSDADPYKYFARYTGEHSVTGRVSNIRLFCNRSQL